MKTVLLLLLLCPTYVWAQLHTITPQDTQRKRSYLLMRDGTLLRGHIVRQDSSMITLRKPTGELSFIEADQVLTISATRPDEEVREKYGVTPSQYTVFILKDGSQLDGTFIRRDSTMITVRKRNGQLTYFEPELLVRVDTIRGGMMSPNEYTPDEQAFVNRFSPWLLTGQTAFAPDKGQFYYRNTLAVLNEFDYGITKNWSVGASFVTPVYYLALVNFYAFNGFLANNSQLFTKLSTPIGRRFRLGLTVTYQDKFYSAATRRGTLTYQVLTAIGTSQRNMTLGFGVIDRGKQRYYVYSSPPTTPIPIDIPIPNQVYLTVGLMQKVSPVLTLISDNRINFGPYRYYADSGGERASISFALRLDRSRHAFDIGLYSLIYRSAYTLDGRTVRILPYVGYNLLIGHKK